MSSNETDNLNVYHEPNHKDKKDMLKEYKKKLFTNKLGNFFIYFSSIIMILCSIPLILKIKNEPNIIYFILVFLFFYGVSILAAIQIKQLGPMAEIQTSKDNTIEFGEDNLISSSIKSCRIQNLFINHYKVVYNLNYSDISKITYDEDLRRLTLFCDCTETIYSTNDGVNFCNFYKETNLKNFNLIIYNFLDKDDLLDTLRKKTNKSIEPDSQGEVEKKFSLSMFAILCLILALLPLIFQIHIVVGKNKSSNKPDFTSVPLYITEQDESLTFTDQDKTTIENIIKKDFASDATIIFLDPKDTIETTSEQEKYKAMTVLAYSDDSDDVYTYIFNKYLTKSKKHDLGSIEKYGSTISKSVTKEDLKNK